MSTEPASSRYVSDYLHSWYIRLYLPLPLPLSVQSRTESIRWSTKDDFLGKRGRENWSRKWLSNLLVRQLGQRCFSTNFCSISFYVALCAPSTSLFPMPPIDRLYTYFIRDCNWTVPKMVWRANYQNWIGLIETPRIVPLSSPDNLNQGR